MLVLRSITPALHFPTLLPLSGEPSASGHIKQHLGSIQIPCAATVCQWHLCVCDVTGYVSCILRVCLSRRLLTGVYVVVAPWYWLWWIGTAARILHEP